MEKSKKTFNFVKKRTPQSPTPSTSSNTEINTPTTPSVVPLKVVIPTIKSLTPDEWIDLVMTHINSFNTSNLSLYIEEVMSKDRIDKLVSTFSASITKEELKILKHIKASLKAIPKLGDVFPATYVLPSKMVTEYSEVLKVGRMTVKNGIGLQGLSRAVRNYLILGIYIDVDIVNCQIVLCREAFKNMKCDYDELDKLIDNREEIFEIMKNSEDLIDFRDNFKIMHGSRDEVKGFVLSLLFDYEPKSRFKKVKALTELNINNHISTKLVDFSKLANQLENGTLEIVGHDALVPLSAHLEKLRDKKYSNEVGTVFSYFLQQLELGCCILARNFFEALKYKCGMHGHDGLHILMPSADFFISEEVFKSCGVIIKKKLNVSVTFIEKAVTSRFFDNSGKYVNEDGSADTASDEFYKKQVEIFEGKWAFISHPFQFYTHVQKTSINRCRDDDEDVDLVTSSLERFELNDLKKLMTYSNYGVINGARFCLDKWLKLPTKHNEASELIMNPSKEPGLVNIKNASDTVKAFNIFKGFAYPKSSIVDIESPLSEYELKIVLKPWFDLLGDIVGGDSNVDEGVSLDYVLNWKASVVQKPTRKTGVGLIFRGGMGDGKDFIVDEGIGSIIGSKGGYLVSNNIGEDILGNFNGPAAGKILIKAEELSFGDVVGREEKMKSYITCNTIMINDKNESRYCTDDFSNYIFTTNNAVPTSISTEDRRFCIFKSKGIKRSWNEWGNLRSHFSTIEFKQTLCKYLHTRVIPIGWSAKDDRPVTKSYSYAILANSPAHAKALDYICNMNFKELNFRDGIKYKAETNILICKPRALLDLVNEQCVGSKTRYGQIKLNNALREDYGMELLKTGHKKEGVGIDCPPIYLIKDEVLKVHINISSLQEFLKVKGWHEELW